MWRVFFFNLCFSFISKVGWLLDTCPWRFVGACYKVLCALVIFNLVGPSITCQQCFLILSWTAEHFCSGCSPKMERGYCLKWSCLISAQFCLQTVTGLSTSTLMPWQINLISHIPFNACRICVQCTQYYWTECKVRTFSQQDITTGSDVTFVLLFSWDFWP